MLASNVDNKNRTCLMNDSQNTLKGKKCGWSIFFKWIRITTIL
uniref:Uncharacterized protein n=1 Tax=Arundo donax TaxID=35708 RepID=A0A0A9HMV7_ARUDO